MSEQPNAMVQPQQVEQPVAVPTTTPAVVATPTPEVVEQGLEARPEPIALTEQKVLELIEKRATEIASQKSLEAVKQAQSLTDKLGARLNKEVEDRLKAYEVAAGAPLTYEQRLRLEQATREQLKVETQEAPAPVQNENPLMADVKRIAEKYDGTIITNADPEFVTVKVDGTLGEWYTTYERAVKAKASRESKQTPSVEENAGDPKARIATTPQKGTAGLPDMSATDLFKQAYKKQSEGDLNGLHFV